MKSAYFLPVLAAGLMTNTACSTPRIATAILPAPAACLTRCDPLTPPPGPNDNIGRLEWELHAIDDYATCSGQHDDCAAESIRRLKSARHNPAMTKD